MPVRGLKYIRNIAIDLTRKEEFLIIIFDVTLMKSKYSERVGAVEGGEQEPVSSFEEGGKSDCTNPSAADGNPGGPHGGRQ